MWCAAEVMNGNEKALMVDGEALKLMEATKMRTIEGRSMRRRDAIYNERWKGFQWQ